MNTTLAEKGSVGDRGEDGEKGSRGHRGPQGVGGESGRVGRYVCFTNTVEIQDTHKKCANSEQCFFIRKVRYKICAWNKF